MTNEAMSKITAPVSIAPLVTLRILFGAMMVISTVRFMALGWVKDHYLDAKITFKYYGFDWVQVLPEFWMYALHVLMLAGAVGILLGAFYRLSAWVFFLTFTYCELIDLTYYLNHYYFVSLVAFMLTWVPAGRSFSVDAWRKPSLRLASVPRWCIAIFQLQTAIVYTYAGLAKINHDWLIEALPLRIWLPAADKIPIIGPLLDLPWMPWAFSWVGMLYDCTIVGWLLWRPTRPWAFAAVVVFHVLVGILFQIGVFPLVMIAMVTVFFSARWHERWQGRWYLPLFNPTPDPSPEKEGSHDIRRDSTSRPPSFSREGSGVGLNRGGVGGGVVSANFKLQTSNFKLLSLFFLFQLLFPWRYLLYPGNLFWTEEGYRFSWRVMLMEKAGTATFFVKDSKSKREGEVVNSDFLCAHQEKQVAMQPDMVLQYAHFLKKHYAAQGMADPQVRAEVWVTLNGRPSRLLLDPQLDLTKIEDGWGGKKWIYRYE